MFGSLKKKLILLYGITTSIVLVVILCILGYLTQVQSENYRRNSFEQTVATILEKLESGQTLSALWVAQIQNSNDIYLYVEENEQPYTLIINNTLTKQYQNYIDEVKELALAQNLNLTTPLIKKQLQKTNLYELKVDRVNKVFASGAIIPTDSNCYTIIIVERYEAHVRQFYERLVTYGIIGIAGIGALFLISSIYIKNVIKPLEKGQKKQVDFIAAASHELRSPVTVIQAGLSAIKEEPDQMNNFMPYLEDECQRMNHLISDLLLLATSDAKSWSLQKEKIDMDTFLIEIYDMFCCMQKERGSSIRLELSEEALYPVYADRERLKQVLTILIDNGWSYTEKEQGITLKAYNRKHQVVIEVIDHGPGIPEEEKEKVFERFYQGDQSRNDKKHYGLGLSIAKEIVTLHGGSLIAKDTEGHGATFSLGLRAEE